MITNSTKTDRGNNKETMTDKWFEKTKKRFSACNRWFKKNKKKDDQTNDKSVVSAVTAMDGSAEKKSNVTFLFMAEVHASSPTNVTTSSTTTDTRNDKETMPDDKSSRITNVSESNSLMNGSDRKNLEWVVICINLSYNTSEI